MTLTATNDFAGRLAILLTYNAQTALVKTVTWINARRWRRIIIWPNIFVQAWLIFTTVMAPEAAASVSAFGTAAVAWMGVKDSSGVPVAAYQMSIDHGSVRNPGRGLTSTLVQAEFGLWIVYSTMAIWFICWVLSFNWLNLFSDGFLAVSNALTETLSTPVVFALAVSVGVIPIAWHFVLGRTAKGAIQLGMVLCVAVLSTTVLANPVSMLLGSDGAIAQSRDVGLAIATTINGEPSSDATVLINRLQGQMVDAYIRAPLQEWNFGTVLDNEEPACAQAWTTAQMSGDEDNIKDSIASCASSNASAMKYVADHPSGGMLGTGILLIIMSFVLQIFSVAIGFMIIIDAFTVVFEGFKLIVGFAATGYIPGGFQTSLVTSAVGAALALLQMAAYVVFLGVWCLLLQRLMTNSHLSGMAGITIVAVLLIAGIALMWQLRRRRKRRAQETSTKLAAVGDNPAPAQPVSAPARLHQVASTARDVRGAYQGAVNATKKTHAIFAAKPIDTTDSDKAVKAQRKHADANSNLKIAQAQLQSLQAAGETDPNKLTIHQERVNKAQRQVEATAPASPAQPAQPAKAAKAAKVITRVGVEAAVAAATGGTSAVKTVAVNAAKNAAADTALTAALNASGSGPIPAPPGDLGANPPPAPAGGKGAPRAPLPATPREPEGVVASGEPPNSNDELPTIPPPPAASKKPDPDKRPAVDMAWATADSPATVDTPVSVPNVKHHKAPTAK